MSTYDEEQFYREEEEIAPGGPIVITRTQKFKYLKKNANKLSYNWDPKFKRKVKKQQETMAKIT